MKRESSVSFDLTKTEAVASMRSKNVKRVLEVTGENIKKEVGVHLFLDW